MYEIKTRETDQDIRQFIENIARYVWPGWVNIAQVRDASTSISWRTSMTMFSEK